MDTKLTRGQKIGIASKKRWAEDPVYRREMTERWKGKKHESKSILKMSKARKLFWKKLRKNPEKYNETIERIGLASKLRIHPKGEKARGWKGGFYKTNGYVYKYFPSHPNCNKKGYILESRLVMEKKLGRLLVKGEDVHHKNGIKDDNRPKNLQVVGHFSHFEEYGCPKCHFKFLTK